MQTPAIPNIANVIQGPASAIRQADATPDVPFNQMLSRQMADRSSTTNQAQNSNKSNANKSEDSSNADTPSQTSVKDADGSASPQQPSGTDGKKVAGKDKTDETSNASAAGTDTTPAASAELLALVANLNQASVKVSDAAAVSAPQTAGKDLDKTAGLGKDLASATDIAATAEAPDVGKASKRTDGKDANVKADATFKSLVDQATAKVQPGDGAASDAKADPAAAKAATPATPSLPTAAAVAAPASPAVAIPKELTEKSTAKAASPRDLPIAKAAVTSGKQSVTAAITSEAGTAKIKDAGVEHAASNAPSADFNAVKSKEAFAGQSGAAAASTDMAVDKISETSTASVPATPVYQQVAAANAIDAANVRADRIAPQVGTTGWDQAVGQKVVWMVEGGQQSASLTLNPPDLGPLKIMVNITNSQADATFIAAQPEVRQALEAALPKLREMMSDSGIQLGQATVSAGMPNQHNAPGEQQRQTAARFDQQSGDLADATVRATRTGAGTGAQGLVDTFA